MQQEKKQKVDVTTNPIVFKLIGPPFFERPEPLKKITLEKKTLEKKTVKNYVAELEDECYYVGETTRDDVQIRFLEHVNGVGAEWTRLHKPKRLVCIYEGLGGHHETAIVLELMQIHGVDKVRGGAFSTVELSRETRAVIEHLLRSGSNRCFRCGSNMHFIRDCPSAVLVPPPTAVAPTPPRPPAFVGPRIIKCGRCGRTGHGQQRCFARFF